jgi:hypothetical protein
MRLLRAVYQEKSAMNHSAYEALAGSGGRDIARETEGQSMTKSMKKIFPSSPPDRCQVAHSKDARRSRITNGTALVPGVDGRSAWIRRCRDVIASHLSDLGGEDNTSAAERSIVRRVAVLTCELENLEARFAAAGEASADALDLYQRTSGNLRRLLETIGLQRRAKDVSGDSAQPVVSVATGAASDVDPVEVVWRQREEREKSK